jgi:hypothetical protein
MKKSRRSFWFFVCVGGLGGLASGAVFHSLQVENFAAMMAVSIPTNIVVFLLVGSFRKFILHKSFLPDMRQA